MKADKILRDLMRGTKARIRTRRNDCIVLLRVYDDTMYYACVDDDAEAVAKILRTSTEDGIFAFEHSRLDTYLPAIIKSGHSVAIAEIE